MTSSLTMMFDVLCSPATSRRVLSANAQHSSLKSHHAPHSCSTQALSTKDLHILISVHTATPKTPGSRSVVLSAPVQLSVASERSEEHAHVKECIHHAQQQYRGVLVKSKGLSG